MSKNLMTAMLFIATPLAAWSQTRLDLRTQAKNVDFSSSLSTKPVRVGTAMPGTCSAGELFFKSDAPAGSNLLGCTATNTWSLMSTAAGTLGPFYCADTGAVNAYSCTGVTGLSSLTTGQLILVKPGTTNTAAATLNINGLGAKAIRKNAGQALASGDIAAGQVATLAYDGTTFQMQSLAIAGPAGPAGPTGATGATGATGPAGPAIGGLLTTKGDTVGHNGSAAVRLGVCPDGQSYIADSTQAAGWRCATSGGGSGQGIGLCAPQGGNGADYTCSVPGVSSYTTSLTVLFRPDVTSAGPATLNVNSLGAKAIMRSSANGVVAGELAGGKPYLLSYDGVTFTIAGEQLEPDGSGTVTVRRDVVPHTIGVAAGVFGGLNSANVWMGNNDFSNGYFIPPQRTVSTLPVAAAHNKKLFIVTDGATASDCSTGGGANVVLCRSNGSTYAALSGTSGVGGTAGPGGPTYHTHSLSPGFVDHLGNTWRGDFSGMPSTNSITVDGAIIPMAEFSNAGTAAGVQFPLPASYDSTAPITLTLTVSASEWVAGGQAKFTPYGFCAAAAGNLKAASFQQGTPVTLTLGADAAGYYLSQISFSIPTTGCAPNDLLVIKIVRASDDSYGGSVWLVKGALQEKS